MKWMPTTDERTVTVHVGDDEYVVEYRWIGGWSGARNPLERPEFEVIAIIPEPPQELERRIIDDAIDAALWDL